MIEGSTAVGLRVVPYTESMRGSWDDFARANGGAVGHLSAAFELESERHHARNCSLLVVDGETLVATLPLFVRRRPLLKVLGERVMSTGGYFRSGPLFSRTATKQHLSTALALLIDEARRRAAEEGCDRIQVSYPTVVGDTPAIEHLRVFPLRQFGFVEEHVVASLVDLAPDETEIFRNLTSKCRNMVRRSEKEGAVFHEVRDRSEWMECYALNIATLGDRRHSQREFELIWDSLVQSGFATVTGTRHQGKLTSVVVVAGAGKSCYYWMGFSSREHQPPGANNFALWHTMLLWKKRGATFFEMGSIELSAGKQGRISDFKESFGGRPYYALGGSVVLKPAKRAAVDLLRIAASRIRGRAPTRQTSADDRG